MLEKLLIFGNKNSFWVTKLRRRDLLLKEYLWITRVSIHHNGSALFASKFHPRVIIRLRELLNVGLLRDQRILVKFMNRPNALLQLLFAEKNVKHKYDYRLFLTNSLLFFMREISWKGQVYIKQRTLSFVVFSFNYLSFSTVCLIIIFLLK